jgi:succinate dehydrogenase / fumarate reductase membrane anchor subunit
MSKSDVTSGYSDAMRSNLGRARGLGAARSGSAVWWAERMTSVALAPLTVWFVVSVISLTGATQAAVAHWASWPVNTVLLLALVAFTFHHMQLGLRVVIEDYVHHEGRKIASILAVQAVTILLALTCILAILGLAGYRAHNF